MNEKIKEFIDLNCFEIHHINKDNIKIGIIKGYSKVLNNYGFSRKEQIKIIKEIELLYKINNDFLKSN